MTVALTVFAVVAGVLALLAIPVDVRLSVDCRETWSGQASVRWLLGVVRLSGSAPPETKNAERLARAQTRKRRRSKRKGSRIPWRGMRAALTSPGFARRGLQFAPRVVSVIRFRSLSGSARIGLDDPADTGLLWGVLGPLSTGIAALPFANIRIEPEFANPTFVAHGTANVRVVPARLAWTVVAFLISPVTVRAAWAAARR